MRAQRIVPLCAATLLAACAVAPPPRAAGPDIEVPAAWSGRAAGTGEIPDAWWRDMGDADLTSIVEEALRRNPRLDEAAARIRAARALATAAGANLVPSVGAGAAAGRQRRFTGKVPGLDPTQRTDSYGVSLDLGWEVDLWGRIRAGASAAVADVQTWQALHHGARLSVAAQTAKAYLASVESRLQLAVALAYLASAEDLAGRVRERFEEGLRQVVDVKLADSEVSGARAAAHRRRQAYDLTLRQLEVLAGRYPAATAPTAAALPAVPCPAPIGVPADVLSRRPDLVAAERRLAAATARVSEAEAALYPRISLTGSRGLASDDLADLLGGDFGVWSLVGNLTAPLFEGGRLEANVAATEARRDEEVAAFANAVLGAFLEVETALAAEGYLDEQVTALEAFERDAREGVALVEERYLSGLPDILAVLEARRRHFDAMSALLAVQRERLAARVDLHVALGGGFRRAANEPPEEES